MTPWLILTAVLLLVIFGLIIERAISDYFNRKEFRQLRASQERGFSQLGIVQKELFRALRLSYIVAAKMSKFAIDEMKMTNEKLGIPQTPARPETDDEAELQSKLWPDVVHDKKDNPLS